jgi:hypothetical protein
VIAPVLLTACLLLSLAGSANAGSATARAGDLFTIGSSDVGCVVASQPTSVSCAPALTNGRQPVGSYGVVLSADGASIFQYRKGNKIRVVLQRFEPRTRGKTFPEPHARKRMIFRVEPGDRLLIGGSDIACAGARNTKANLKVIGCEPVNAHLDQIPGGWGIYLSGDLLALMRVDRAGNVIKFIHRAQP